MAGSEGDSSAEQEQWTAIAEGLYSPAVVAVGERGLLLFARDGVGALSVREHDGKEWAPARTLESSAVPVEGPFTACSTSDGSVHLLARGLDGELLHGTFRDRAWGGFVPIGVPSVAGVPMGLAAAPSACSRAAGEMDVFAVNIGGDLLQAAWSQTGFTPFEPLGAAPGPVAATACGNRAVALLTRGSDGDLLVRWRNGEQWTSFVSLGAPEEEDVLYPGIPQRVRLSSAPIAAGGGPARLDVFARSPAGDLAHIFWNGKEWSSFKSLGTPRSAPLIGSSLACAWRKFRLDLFARAADGKLYTRVLK